MSQRSAQRDNKSRKPVRLCVGIAAAPESLASLRSLLHALPADSGMSVIVLVSLGQASANGQDGRSAGSDDGRARIEQFLSEASLPLGLEFVTQTTRVKANTIYVVFEPLCLSLVGSTLHVVPPPPTGMAGPADQFLSTLAEERHELAVGILLADSGSDGLLGLKSINDAGGMTIVQRPEHDNAPTLTHAHTSGIDHLLPLADIAVELARYAQHVHETSQTDREVELNKQIIEAIPTIADAVERHTSHNFRHYKVTTLARRIKRRMQVLKQSSVSAYVDVVCASRDEAGRLFRDLLISVTCFFRDAEAFQALERTVVPRLLDQQAEGDTLRVWVAGCATGEEAYTLAIVLHEGIKKTGRDIQLQLFATDLDERALQTARGGSYPVSIADDVPSEILKNYFIKRGMRYVVSKSIRECITFSAHNLISDPPFTKLDLISCRNLLIYLGSHLQKKLIPLFHYALRPGGFLFLGPSESMSSHKELFRPISAKHRISQRRATSIAPPSPQGALRGTLARSIQSSDESRAQVDLHQLGQRITLDEFSAQWAIIDEDAQILSLSADTSPYLKLAEGSFQNNVIKMAHEGLRSGLRSALAEAKRIKRQVVHDNLSIKAGGGVQRVVITVQPMPQVGQESGLYYIAFQMLGRPIVRTDDDPAAQSSTAAGFNTETIALVEQLERELATTREDLERTVQELETANEELKSSNEELLSMNEELHSANEELETSKEEVQTSNDALARINSDLENLLRSTDIATIFLTSAGNIRGFTPAITSIYGLIGSDVGRPLSQLNPLVAEMPPLPDMETLIAASGPVEDTIQTLDGRWYIRRVLPYFTADHTCDGSVITFVDVTPLRESEYRLAAALRGGSVSAFDIDLRTLRVWRTAEHDALFGYPHNLDDWSYDHFVKHVVPEQKDDVERQFQRCFEVDDWTLECEIIRVDGERRWLFARGQPVRDHRGEAVRMFGTLGDITQRKQVEQALADSADHVRRIIDNMLGFVGVLSTDGVLLDANATALKAGGLIPEDVAGKHFWDCYWWSHDEFEMQRVRESIARARQGETVRYDARVRMAGGRIIDIDFMLVPALNDQGQITHLIPSGIDITERKTAEQAVRESEAFTRSVLDNMSQFAWIGDETGSLIWYNQRWYDYTGTTFEQMKGWGWQSVQHPDYVDQVTEKYKHAVENGLPWEDTFPLRSRDGHWRWFLSRAVPIRNAEGRITRWFGTNTDISERIAIESELEQARRQAEAANQAKSDFLANMSHEIRTPMTAILGFADLLEAHSEDEREKVETIRRNGQFLLELINDILDLSKIEAGKIEIDVLRFSPSKLVEDVCSLMHVRAVESNLQLRVEFDGTIPDVIENDPIRVRQILINLVGNAIKFTHEGSITLRLSYDAVLKLLRFDVIDTGIGITPELQAKLFKPFEQGDSSIVRRYGGSGLGLAISQRLAQVLGGKIEVTSQPGLGSTFTLSISCGDVPDMKLVAYSSSNDWTMHEIATEYGDNFLGRSITTSEVGSGTLNLRVLVVDDRRDIRFLTQHFVRQVGGEVLLAENGKQALSIADQERSAGRMLDIILMDVQMPEMDGITATRHLRSTNYTGPIIALTANAMDSDREACLSAGYTDYLSKPIDATQLIDMLRRYAKGGLPPTEAIASNSQP